MRIGKVGDAVPARAASSCASSPTASTRILVVEEKRSFLEMQVREILYDRRSGRRFWANRISRPPANSIRTGSRWCLRDVLKLGATRLPALARSQVEVARTACRSAPAAFCSGCPHNRSTLLLEGQIAGGGIGCHTMAMRLGDPSRSFEFLTQMGGEGAPWIGMAPFVDHEHIFQNIGDGTLFHSGFLAIEACVAAGVNITYKILYNGHVAMTGGQIAVGRAAGSAAHAQAGGRGRTKTVVLAEDPRQYARPERAGLECRTALARRTAANACASWRRSPASP